MCGVNCTENIDESFGASCVHESKGEKLEHKNVRSLNEREKFKRRCTKFFTFCQLGLGINIMIKKIN